MLRLIAAISCALLLVGCNTVVPHLSVYDGLLPPGYQVKDSPEQLNPATLRHKTVVIVTTTNFDNYTKQWIDYYEKGGAEQRKAKIGWIANLMPTTGTAAPIGSGMSSGLGNFDSGVAANRQASDPRILVERVMGTLRRSFKSVKAAPDFAAAREMKADYIVLVDYHFTANPMGDVFSARGGVYLLDGKLRRVFSAEGRADVDRGGDVSGAATTQQVLNSTINQIMTTVNARLGVAQR